MCLFAAITQNEEFEASYICTCTYIYIALGTPIRKGKERKKDLKAILGHLGSILGQLGIILGLILGHFGAILGHLVMILGHLGTMGPYRAILDHLGAVSGHIGPT